jgi:hypothetical protein
MLAEDYAEIVDEEGDYSSPAKDYELDRSESTQCTKPLQVNFIGKNKNETKKNQLKGIFSRNIL